LSSNYVSFRIADNPAFIGNAGLTIGNAVVATVGNANLSNADKTKLMTLTVNAGGYFTTGETANQRDVEISSLSGGGTVGNFVTANSTVTSILTINGGSLTSSTTFSGSIVDTDSTTFTGSTNGKIALVKSGSTTQILSGANTYTGNTTVSAGTLLINGSTGASAFAVNGSGTLGGNGTIGGSVTIASGGTLSPGNSPGLLTVNGTLTLGGTANMEVATGTRGTNYDAVNVGASQLLTYGGVLTLTMTSGIADATYDLFSFTTGQYTGNFSSIAFAGGYYSGSFSRTGDLWTSALTQGQIFTFNQANGDLIAAVPEPSTWALLAFSLTLVALLRRRTRV